MQFTVPQFIERESKIFGPFTFRQFIYLGVAGAICFILYFPLYKKQPIIFILIAIYVVAMALILGLVKIEGRSIPIFVKNLFVFTLAPKLYLWRRKSIPPKFMKIKPKKEAEAEPGLNLTFAERSKLKKLSTDIEIRTK